MIWLYNLSIGAYHLLLHLASAFHPKARKWVIGRKEWQASLKSKVEGHEQIVWFHCASLGEFEQGRPLLEKIRVEYPDHAILLTFFSPSGYEVRKNYEGADIVAYLPIDSRKNATAFVDIVQPKLAVFVKYEIWFHYLSVLEKRKIPCFLISSIFRESQVFFKWYGRFYKKMLQRFTHIFVQNEASFNLLTKHGIDKVSVSGDTRFDRVQHVADSAQEITWLREFAGEHKVMILGSSWPKDEQLAVDLMNAEHGWKFIIAPHEIRDHGISKLQAQIQRPSIRYSACTAENAVKADILIIDSIGLLSGIYRYGHIAMIGGGFGAGIHNILEAAVFGLPVLFGPKHEKFNEATELKQLGGAFAVETVEEVNLLFAKLNSDSTVLDKASAIAAQYVKEKVGATAMIFTSVKKFL